MMNRLLPAIRRSRPQERGLTTNRSDLGVLICHPLRGDFQVRIMTAAIHTRRQVLVAAAAAAFVLLSTLAAAQDLVQKFQQQGGRTLSSASGSRVKQMAKFMPKMSETCVCTICTHLRAGQLSVCRVAGSQTMPCNGVWSDDECIDMICGVLLYRNTCTH